MNISLTQAKIIKKLYEAEPKDRTSAFITKELEFNLDYVYRQFQQLKIYELIQVKQAGRKKFYEPTDLGVDIANEKIEEEVKRRIHEQKSSEKYRKRREENGN